MAKPPLFLTGSGQRVDDVLVCGIGGGLEPLAEGLPGHGPRARMNQAGIQQELHDDGYTSDDVDVRHHVLARRLQVSEFGHLRAHPLDIVEVQLYARLERDREHVKDGIGRPAHRGHDRHGVLKCLSGQDVPRPRVRLEDLHHRPAALVGLLHPQLARGNGGGAVWNGQSECLDGRGHGVGGEHPAAGPVGGTCDALQLVELLRRHRPPRDGAGSLEDVLYRYPLPVPLAGRDAPSVEIDAGEVGPRHRHHACRLCLVAAANGHERVELVADGAELDRVRDDLPANQHGLHPFMPHRYGVVDRDGVELQGRPASVANPLLHLLGDLAQVVVAGLRLDPSVRDADNRLLEILVSQSDGPEHGSLGGPLHSSGQSIAHGPWH